MNDSVQLEQLPAKKLFAIKRSGYQTPPWVDTGQGIYTSVYIYLVDRCNSLNARLFVEGTHPDKTSGLGWVMLQFKIFVHSFFVGLPEYLN